MENENSVISKVDVRIIVSGLDIAEVVSKSVDNTQLERDYNIIVSSIIPTNNFEIAKKVAKIMNKSTMSAQAVGGAVGHNPISIIIPCHRVIGTNGSLTGYAGGIDKKIFLLKHEGASLKAFDK